MARKANDPANFVWRDGRPRWSPGPTLRRRGWKGRDLKRPDGSWMAMGEAIEAAIALNRTVAERKEAGIARAPTRARQGEIIVGGRRLPTVEDVIEAMFKSPDFQAKTAGRDALAPRTIADYRSKANVLAAFDPELVTAPAAAVSKVVARKLFERLWKAKGLSMANGIIAVLSTAYARAELTGLVTENPCLKLKRRAAAPRLRVGTFAEMQALVAAADRLNLPEIGDAIYLGLFTGQRQGDRLSLTDTGAQAGWRIFRQSKTGAVVEVPDAPQLAARLAAARERRAAANVKVALVVVDPVTRRQMTGRRFNGFFRRVRAEAARAVPSVATFNDQDCRDTAVTWLAQAGCTVPQIRAITGHAEQSVYAILKHYLATDRAMASTAIGRLVAYLDEQGAAL